MRLFLWIFWRESLPSTREMRFTRSKGKDWRDKEAERQQPLGQKEDYAKRGEVRSSWSAAGMDPDNGRGADRSFEAGSRHPGESSWGGAGRPAHRRGRV